MARSWSFPPFRLEVDMGSLWRDDALVPPPKPFALLAALAARAGAATALGPPAWAELKTDDAGVEGSTRVAPWSAVAGRVSPHANRLTFLSAHAEDDPTANHFHRRRQVNA